MITLQQIKNLKQYDKIYTLDKYGHTEEIHFMGIAPINSMDKDISLYAILYSKSSNEAYTFYIHASEPNNKYYLDESEALNAGIAKAEQNLTHEKESFERVKAYNIEQLIKNGTRSIK